MSLNLFEELTRGPHRYDMLKIDEQRAGKPKRLSRLMEWMKVIFCPLRYSRPVALEPKEWTCASRLTNRVI